MKWELPEGATVKVKHFRRVGDDPNFLTMYDIRESGLTPSPQGGRTEAVVKTVDGREALGVAECSNLDNYNRTIGRLIATGRALKELNGGYPVEEVNSNV